MHAFHLSRTPLAERDQREGRLSASTPICQMWTTQPFIASRPPRRPSWSRWCHWAVPRSGSATAGTGSWECWAIERGSHRTSGVSAPDPAIDRVGHRVQCPLHAVGVPRRAVGVLVGAVDDAAAVVPVRARVQAGVKALPGPARVLVEIDLRRPDTLLGRPPGGRGC